MKLKNLKKLKNYKHYEKLVNKSKGTGPMPQLRWVSNLLTVRENILVVDYGYPILILIFVLLILTTLGTLGVMLKKY